MFRFCAECNMPTNGNARCIVCYCDRFVRRLCNRCNAEWMSVGCCGECGGREFRNEELSVNATATAPKRAKRTPKPRKVGEVAQERVENLPEETQPAKKPAKKRAAKKRAAAKAAATNGEKKFRCEFGGVSVGEDTARLGIRIQKDAISIKQAEDMFCGRRIQCRVVARPVDDDPDQTYLEGVDMKHAIDAVCDVKRFASSPKLITLGLTFALQEIKVEDLANFAKKAGELYVLDCRSLDEINDDEE